MPRAATIAELEKLNQVLEENTPEGCEAIIVVLRNEVDRIQYDISSTLEIKERIIAHLRNAASSWESDGKPQ